MQDGMKFSKFSRCVYFASSVVFGENFNKFKAFKADDLNDLASVEKH